MMLRRQPKRPRMGLRPEAQWRSRSHLAWIRRVLSCSVPGCNRTPIEAAHWRGSLDAGKGQKPGDQWTLPLCGGVAGHHAEQHRIGEPGFAARHGLDLKSICERCIRESPAYGDYLAWLRENGKEAA